MVKIKLLIFSEKLLHGFRLVNINQNDQDFGEKIKQLLLTDNNIADEVKKTIVMDEQDISNAKYISGWIQTHDIFRTIKHESIHKIWKINYNTKIYNSTIQLGEIQFDEIVTLHPKAQQIISHEADYYAKALEDLTRHLAKCGKTTIALETHVKDARERLWISKRKFNFDELSLNIGLTLMGYSFPYMFEITPNIYQKLLLFVGIALSAIGIKGKLKNY